jgi:hypothetical protein
LAQVAPTASGDVLRYETFTAKQGLLHSEVTFAQSKNGQTAKLNLGVEGQRTYDFINGKNWYVYDNFYKRLVTREKAVNLDAQYQFLPRDKKIGIGDSWKFTRSGTDSTCFTFKGDYTAVAKEGPDTVIEIDSKSVTLKNILIEISADILQGNPACTTLADKITIHYSPELNEITAHQSIEKKGAYLDFGYRIVLKSITTKAGQAAK